MRTKQTDPLKQHLPPFSLRDQSCPGASKRGASLGIFSPSLSWRRLLRCPRESSALRPSAAPISDAAHLCSSQGKPAQYTFHGYWAGGTSSAPPDLEEPLYCLFTGIPCKFCLGRPLGLQGEAIPERCSVTSSRAWPFSSLLRWLNSFISDTLSTRETHISALSSEVTRERTVARERAGATAFCKRKEIPADF